MRARSSSSLRAARRPKLPARPLPRSPVRARRQVSSGPSTAPLLPSWTARRLRLYREVRIGSGLLDILPSVLYLDSVRELLEIQRPDQLKALGHPLRLRVLETLGPGDELTNRELANRLGVDPGHLHFHVRMLLNAGLIDRAERSGGREKPYRAVARP